MCNLVTEALGDCSAIFEPYKNIQHMFVEKREIAKVRPKFIKHKTAKYWFSFLVVQNRFALSEPFYGIIRA